MDNLIEQLKMYEEKNKVFLKSRINDYVAYLIHLKYLCEKGTYTYDEVIENEDIHPNTISGQMINRRNKNRIPLNYLLKLIKDIDLKEVILYFLNTLEKPITFHNKEDKIIYLGITPNMYSYYNRDGNATYLSKAMHSQDYDLFKIFDEVLGVKNYYIIDDTSKPEDFDYVYIYDDIPRYLSKKYSVYDTIHLNIIRNKNVVLYTTYHKISNFSEGRIDAKYLNKIIIDHADTIMLFSYDTNDEISIISTDKITDRSKIDSIIKNNRKQKDVLIKITHQTLKDNNLRIGFKLYQLENNAKLKDINKIVDENTRYLEKLNRINEKVEREINILLNR